MKEVLMNAVAIAAFSFLGFAESILRFFGG